LMLEASHIVPGKSFMCESGDADIIVSGNYLFFYLTLLDLLIMITLKVV
jgi:hypothetical protein